MIKLSRLCQCFYILNYTITELTTEVPGRVGIQRHAARRRARNKMSIYVISSYFTAHDSRVFY